MLFKQSYMKSFADTMELLRHIDWLIRLKTTGNDIAFASQLGCSVITLKIQLQRLNDLGIEIHFNENIKSYEYTNERLFQIILGNRITKKPCLYGFRKFLALYFGIKTLSVDS